MAEAVQWDSVVAMQPALAKGLSVHTSRYSGILNYFVFYFNNLLIITFNFTHTHIKTICGDELPFVL